MRKMPGSFTMRRDGVLPRGDWFNIVMEDGQTPKVYIYDEIGFWGTEASDFVKELNKIDAPLMELHLNSPGGEIFDGLAIYNSIKQHKADVHVYVDGLAASAASFIAQAGNKVIMARNAEMMIHDGIAFAYGNEQDMLDTARVLSNLSNNIADIYAEASKRRGFADATEASWRAFMREEVWYTGREAKDAGLADEVLDTADEEAQAATAKWDLSFYNHAGRAKAESPLRVQQRILLNIKKESSMSQGANEPEGGTTPPETTPAPPPDTTPPSEPAGPAEPGTPAEPEATPAEPAPAVPEAPSSTQPGNSATGTFQGVMIDGKMVTDQAAIQNYVNTTSAAQAEARATNRRGFVEGLAKANKIPAPQVDSLVELVNGKPDGSTPAMSDAQFAAFSASYESAPVIGLFSSHATPDTPPSGSTQNSGAQAGEKSPERKAILEGIVAMHRNASMPQEQLEKTPSWLELQALNKHLSTES
jgi:ATP-dependent protease ClpP protease subunit